jgi:hypothetical protein
MGGSCSTKGGRASLCSGKYRGKETTRQAKRYVDNNKIALAEIRCGGVDWIGLTLDRDKWRAVVNSVMNLWVA